MTNNEIINILSKTVGYDPSNMFFSGNIGSTIPKDQWEIIKNSPWIYHRDIYPKQRKLIESLPWISIKDRLPKESGIYLTLLDCNEHEILTNRFTLNTENSKSNWALYNNTHICYWMPIPEQNDDEVIYESSKMDWHDGGQRL